MRSEGVKRPGLMIVLSILTGLFGAVLIFALGELGVRTLNLQPPGYQPPRLSASLKKTVQDLTDKDASITHLPIHLPSPRFKSHALAPLRPGYLKTPLNFTQWDPEVGALRPAGFHGKVTQYAENGSINYSVTYTVDAHRRRIVPNQEKGHRTHPLLFLGGSFVFGDGLQDDETLPAQAARLVRTYRVYNYGVSAWGPSNLLALTQTRDFGSDMAKDPEGKAIYVFIDDHINRVIGALSIYRAYPGWADSLPNYELSSDGKLRREGMESDRILIDPLYQLLARSRLLEVLGVELPPTLTRAHLRLFTAIVKALRDALKRKLGIRDFYVAFYPGASSLAPAVIPLLDQAGIPSLDYSKVDLTRFVRGATHLPDGHPSAGADQFMARQMTGDLGLIGK